MAAISQGEAQCAGKPHVVGGQNACKHDTATAGYRQTMLSVGEAAWSHLKSPVGDPEAPVETSCPVHRKPDANSSHPSSWSTI